MKITGIWAQKSLRLPLCGRYCCLHFLPGLHRLLCCSQFVQQTPPHHLASPLWTPASALENLCKVGRNSATCIYVLSASLPDSLQLPHPPPSSFMIWPHHSSPSSCFIIKLHQASLSSCSLIQLHEAALTSCSLTQLHHPSLSSCSIIGFNNPVSSFSNILLHDLAPSSFSIILLHDQAPSGFSIILLHDLAPSSFSIIQSHHPSYYLLHHSFP